MDISSDSSLTDLSSDLSSIGSRSPTPPLSYPSPQPSQTSLKDTPEASDTPSRKRPSPSDEETQRKKRKTKEAEPRTTKHLDLRVPRAELQADQAEQLKRLVHVLKTRRKIVVVAGAGISTAAGVPDFRSSNGLFNTLKSENKLKASGKQLFDASVYQTDASTSSFHDMVRTLSTLVKDAKPTEFHHMMATLADEGRLLRLYSQNVDGIDTALPPLNTSIPLNPKGPYPRTIQLHGSLEKMVCSKCNTLSDFDGSLFNGPTPPVCDECVRVDEIRTDHAGKRSHGIGRLRPRMVLYNEHNPDEEAIGRVVTADLRSRPDAVIVVGTSLEIPGVKRIVREMCGTVRDRKNGMAIWVNRNPPPITQEFKDCWDLIVAGDCDAVAKEADMRRWNEEPHEGVRVTSPEAALAKAKESDLQVVVESPQKGAAATPTPPTLPTPAESPRLPPAHPTVAEAEVPTAKIPTKKFRLNGPAPLVGAEMPKLTKAGNIRKKPGPKPKNSLSGPSTAAIAKPRKPKGSKSQPQKPSIILPGISTAFKVNKSGSRTSSSDLKSLKPLSPNQASHVLAQAKSHHQGLPMSPIRPHSAQQNGPVSSSPTGSTSTIIETILESTPLGTPKQELPSPTELAAYSPKGRLQTMSETIVKSASPPRGMEMLLN